jgi:hypothetical protein
MIGQAKIVVATQIEQFAAINRYPRSCAMIKGSCLTKKVTPPDGFQASLYEILCC